MIAVMMAGVFSHAVIAKDRTMAQQTPPAPFSDVIPEYGVERGQADWDPYIESRDVLGRLPGLLADAMASGPGSQSLREQGGLNVREQVKSLVHWVHVAVDRIATGVSSQALMVKTMAGDGSGMSDLVEPTHPLVMLLNSPNPFVTPWQFWVQIVQYLELTGNAVLVKEYTKGGKMAEMWCLPMHYVKPIITSEGFVGVMLEDGQGREMPIPAEMLCHLQYPNPQNRFWGLSKLAAASSSMVLTDNIKAAQIAAFDNDVWSSMVLRTDKELDKEAYKRVMALVRQRYSGVKKAGTPMVFDNNLMLDQLRSNPAEMDFQNSAKMTRDEILAIFGVPPILAGEVGSANRSNAEAQERIFQKYTILPKLTNIEQGLNKDLVPEFDDTGKTFLEFENPVPQDELIAIKRNTANITSGVVSPNEVREQIGADPEPWGELPQWVYEFEALYGYKPGEEPIPPQAPDGGLSDPQDDDDDGGTINPPDDEDDNRSVVRRAIAEELVKRVKREKHRADLLQAANRASLLGRIDREQDDLMVSAQRTLKRYFNKQSERIKRNVRELFAHTEPIPEINSVKRVFLGETGGLMLYPDGSTFRAGRPEGSPIWLGEGVDSLGCYNTQEVAQVLVRMLPVDLANQLDDWERASGDLSDRMRPKLVASLKAGGKIQYEALGVQGSFSINSPQAEAWLQLKQREYWRGTVNATTQNLLSQKLAEVMAAGPTPDLLAKAVDEVMGDRIKSSAATIARTETAGAYNAGSSITRERIGVKKQEWVATFDGRVRSNHLAADGQKIAVGEKFSVGGAMLRYPGDPLGPVAEIVNCRCTVVALDSGSEFDEGADPFVDPAADVNNTKLPDTIPIPGV